MKAPLAGDRAFAIDAFAILLTSVFIVLAAHRLAVMSAVVPAVIALRFVLVALLPRAERGLSLGREAALFAGLTVFGAFNDWNSVCHHRIYDYLVPADVPAISTIPTWMLLYWGMILRFAVTLARWRRLAPPREPRDEVWLGARARRSAALKLAIEIGLVVITRQAIYRLYGHPVLSWLPFALALALYALLFRPRIYEIRLALLFLLGGPVVEVAYITVGLHRYALGWLGGVPLWIALWWVLAMMVMQDVASRVLARLAARGPDVD